jgi:hypothetical protein
MVLVDQIEGLGGLVRDPDPVAVRLELAGPDPGYQRIVVEQKDVGHRLEPTPSRQESHAL